MNDNITIAIDGWSSCGKSTLAKALAKELGYIYVDSGAMYRGVALYALRNGLVNGDSIDQAGVIASLSEINLSFFRKEAGKAELLLNGENVESEIRTLTVSNVVSSIATIKEIRAHLVAQQQIMGEKGGVVMDGRDVGSVIFPNADLKLFVTADPDVRTQRRYKELTAKGDKVTVEEVRANLMKRDEMDANRAIGPLIQTEDSIVIDNSNMTPAEQLTESLRLVMGVLVNRK